MAYFRHKRNALRVARRAAKGSRLKPTQARPHELLLFAALNANANQYEFDLEHDEAIKVLKIAKGLRDRDAFIATGMAIGIVPVFVSSSVEYPTAAAPVYFPDPNIFDTAAGTATLSEAQALESIYWGFHTLQTNEGVRIDRSPNLEFRTVQQTQGSSSTANMQTGIEVKEIGAAIRFGGGDENRIIIDINSSDKTHIGGPAARNNYLMVRLEGSIIKGQTTKVYTR